MEILLQRKLKHPCMGKNRLKNQQFTKIKRNYEREKKYFLNSYLNNICSN